MPITSPGQTGVYKSENVESISLGSGIFGWIYELTAGSVANPILEVTGGGHSLVAGDVGKPLSGDTTGELFNDVDSENAHIGLITSVPDSTHVEYAPPGTTIDIPTALLQGGNAWNLATDGRYADWDLSASLYKPDPEADSNNWLPQLIFINSIDTGASTANVTVLDGETL